MTAPNVLDVADDPPAPHRSSIDNPKWINVDVTFIRELKRPISLEARA